MRVNELLNSLPRLQTTSAPPSPSPTSNARRARGLPTSQMSSLLHRQGFIGAAARFWQKSYASDYLVLAALLALVVLMHLFVEPFHRLFAVDDLRISYPHAEHERVPPLWLLIYAAVVPLAVLTAWAVVVRPPVQKAHVTFLGLLLALFITGFATDLVKNAVGRPRPDLLARCKPAPDTPAHTLVAIDVCTTEPATGASSHHRLHDGWRSFPSGHSSFAFAGLGYLALFLAAQLRALSPRTPLPLALLPLVPLAGALLIAVSRTEDYRHDVWDVTAGSTLGLLLALASYRRYYPSLWARGCDEPFGYRDEGLSPRQGYARASAKDEEVIVGGGADSDDERDGPSGEGGRGGGGGSGRRDAQ